MATIRPFRGLRFTPAAGRLEALVAPPYDVITPEEREALGAQSEHNVTWLTLPEQLPDDRSKFVKYGRSASRLAEWRREGALQPEPTPTFYRYSQTFNNPVTGQQHTRSALVCLLKLEPYEKGIVLPHEQTFPKHKEDRLRLLEATRAQLESIFGLYQDELARVEHAISRAHFDEAVSVTTDDGIQHRLDVCTHPEDVASIAAAMERERVWIADGHHRYETALAFREAAGPHDGLIAEDFMLISLSSMSDPGLVLLPTHRIITRWNIPFAQVENRLQRYFNVRKVANDDLPEAVMSAAASDCRAFGIALPGNIGFFATLASPRDALSLSDALGSDRLKMLDVSILHDVLLKRAFEIEGLERIEYTRNAAEALARVKESTDVAAVITNPPSVEDMRLIAEAGEKMPQKSTYYYPKLLSGLVMWSLSDFEAP